MAISDDFLDELKRRNDIADVVSAYVPLTKRSGANLFGLCPFHGEKTPSFSVNTDRQIYHCFGCGKGGSVINFIQEIENLSFLDAVQFLARRAGMELPEDTSDPNLGRRSRLLALNRDAALFFRDQLLAETGAACQAYVQERGILQMINRFGLGYAPDSWQALIDAMTRKGYTPRELIDAGLARAGKNGGMYDYFRGRLMFPVVDVRGSVIGFSGRVLGNEEPKYLNSPDTPVYSKSRSLFALNLAKKSKAGYLLLVEGNIDVVSLHQAGFDSAVASLGTALTADQARLMARYTQEVVLCYDSDAAGQKAVQRAIGILQPLRLQVKVVTVPGAKDPDEFVRTSGPGAFRKLIEHSGNQIEYRMAQLVGAYDLTDDADRVRYLQEAAKLIASLPGSVEREIYGMRAAENAGVSMEAFMTEVTRVRKQNTAAAKRQREREDTAPLRTAQPGSRTLRYENVRSAVAEEGVINLLYRFPEQFSDVPLAGEDFTSPLLGRLYDDIQQRLAQGRSLSVAALSQGYSSEEMTLLTDILRRDTVSAAAAQQAMRDYIEKIRVEKEKKSRADDLRAYAERLKQMKGHGSNHG